MTDRHQRALRCASLLFPLSLACLADAARSNDLLHQLKQEITDGTYGTIDGLLISQNGDLIVEEYYNGYRATRTHRFRFRRSR